MTTQPNPDPINKDSELKKVLRPFHRYNCHSRQRWLDGQNEPYPCDCDIIEAVSALQAMLDSQYNKALEDVGKELVSLEVDLVATREHMEELGATESEILNMELEADDRQDVLNDVRQKLASLTKSKGSTS